MKKAAQLWNKTIRFILRLYSLTLLVLLLVIAFSANLIWPNFFSDENIFLKEFVSTPILATMGFIVSITLTGINSLFVNIQRLGKEKGQNFQRVKTALKLSAYTLIFVFCVTIALVVLKHSYVGKEYDDILNIIALALLYANISVLVDITGTALNLPDP